VAHDGALEWLRPAAAQEGLPVAMMGGLFLPKFREIADRHPDLKMILDHCGLNRHGRDAEAFIHFDELVALARLPNVTVKATGAPHYSTQPYPFRSAGTSNFSGFPGRACPQVNKACAKGKQSAIKVCLFLSRS
jgi:hypothetical protein